MGCKESKLSNCSGCCDESVEEEYEEIKYYDEPKPFFNRMMINNSVSLSKSGSNRFFIDEISESKMLMSPSDRTN